MPAATPCLSGARASGEGGGAWGSSPELMSRADEGGGVPDQHLLRESPNPQKPGWGTRIKTEYDDQPATWLSATRQQKHQTCAQRRPTSWAGQIGAWR